MDSIVNKDDAFYFIQSLIPKSHIQASEFIQENPSFDGRNIRIAIWDTGVDPASEGLQITTEGKPKLINMCDTSGSGDVQMCVDSTIDEKRILKLLSNREVSIPQSWNIKDNHIKLGTKSAFDIFPAPIITRLSKDYKENVWNKEFNRLHSEINEEKQRTKQSNSLLQMEPTLLIECLEILEKSFEYPIPILDCLVFHDGEDWTACVDTSPLNPDLELDNMPLLYSYDKKRQYSNFGGKTNLNFGINIHDDGTLLEIVSCSGSHGTHVASIAAGFFPGKPECNGIAPGAEVVSLKISDTRLGSMETGMSLAFAAKLTVQLKCDIVNLSFGEASIQANCGRVCLLMQELVTKHGIIFCSSSGNNGPALSTVGSPGGTTDTLFGISPMVFPDMVESNYSLPIDKLEDLSPEVYTWASRGPALDGSLGIHVAAPGAAITSVGTWQVRNIGLMNGSSMSSPNACGGFTLLLSAARQLKKPMTPWLLSLASMNTASLIPDIGRLSQGHGLLQVKAAFMYLQKYWFFYEKSMEKQGDIITKTESLPIRMDLKEERKITNDSATDVKSYNSLFNKEVSELRNNTGSETPLHLFRIKCTVGNGNRGIFLREPYETNQLKQFTINVAPDFDKDKLEISHQVNINMYLHIVCKASWVTCPRFLNMFNQERSFTVKVDPRALNRNMPEYEVADNDCDSDYGVYFTEIELYCLEYSHLGALARLPVTVYKSEPVTELQISKRMIFKPNNKTVRHFLATQPGADSMLLQIKPISIIDGSGRFDIRINQFQPNCSTVSSELSRSFCLDKKSNAGVIDCVSYMLSGSLSSNIEVTFAQYWSSSSPAELEYSIDFHGIKVSADSIKMTSSDNHYRLLIESHLQMEEISPAICSTFLVQPLRPFKEEISYVHKSVSIDKELINLDLFYSFNIPKSGDVGVFCPALGNLLYENDFYSQIYQISDSHDRIVGTGDYKPEIYFFKLDKGDYKVRLQIRHGSLAQLDRLKEQPILIYFKSYPALSFEFSKSLVDINNNKTYSNGKLNYSISKGEKVVLYITSNVLKVLKQFSVGSYILGNLTLYKNEHLKKTVAYPVQFTFVSNVSSVHNKSDHVPSYKLSTQLCAEVCKSMNLVVQSPHAETKTKEEEVTEIIQHTEEIPTKTDVENMEDLMTLSKNHSDFQDSLISQLLPWIIEFHIETERNSVAALIKKVDTEDRSDILLAQLKAYQKFKTGTDGCHERWNKIETLSNDLIKLWDTKELSEFFGAKHSDASLLLKKEQKAKLEKNKQNLLEVFCIYGLSICEKLGCGYDATEVSDGKTSLVEKLEKIYCQVCRFVSPWDNNSVCLPFFVVHSYSTKCYGRLLKLLLRGYDDQASAHLLNLIHEVLLKMKWNVFAEHYERLVLVKHPLDSRTNVPCRLRIPIEATL